VLDLRIWHASVDRAEKTGLEGFSAVKELQSGGKNDQGSEGAGSLFEILQRPAGR
jgi:hypothetical protein